MDSGQASSGARLRQTVTNPFIFHEAGGTETPDMSTSQSIPRTAHRSFLQSLRDGAEAARKAADEDPWEPVLRALKGKIAADGIERISTHEVFDELEVPMKRRPSQTVRLSRVMRRLGWTNIRARGLSRGSYRDRVRGYAREVPGHPATLRLQASSNQESNDGQV